MARGISSSEKNKKENESLVEECKWMHPCVNDYPIPAELRERLDKNQALHTAFHALTSGRQKAYLFYYNQAKQAKTAIYRNGQEHGARRYPSSP